MIFTGNLNNIVDVSTTCSLLNSDHFLLEFTYCEGIRKNVLPTRYVYHWNSVNYDKLNYKLSLLNLEQLVIDYAFNENILWLKWKQAVYSVINKMVKKKCNKKRLVPLDGW